MAFTTSEGDFRAGTLGDLFIPIQKMYAHLFATFIPPYRPDRIHADNLYAQMAACRDKTDFKRFLYAYRKWGGPEGKSPFDLRMYKLEGNRIELPQSYVDGTIPQFSLGHIHSSRPPYFSHSGALKRVHSVPPTKIIVKDDFIKTYAATAAGTEEKGITNLKMTRKMKNLFQKMAILDRDFPLSKLAGPVPKYVIRFKTEFAIEMGCFFDTGVSLKAQLTQNDIRYQIAITHGYVSAPDIKIKQGFDLKIFSGGMVLDLPGGIIRLHESRGRELEKSAMGNYFENTESVKKIRKMLSNFKSNEFGVILSYTPTPPNKETGGFFVVASYFTPEVSRFGIGDFRKNLRDTGLRLLSFRLRDTIGKFLVANMQELIREFDPDQIQEAISAKHPRRGEGKGFFSNGGK